MGLQSLIPPNVAIGAWALFLDPAAPHCQSTKHPSTVPGHPGIDRRPPQRKAPGYPRSRQLLLLCGRSVARPRATIAEVLNQK